MAYTRARPEWKPTGAILRARAVEALAIEVRERGLTGRALQCYVYETRARLGNDMAIDLALKLLESRES